ncbi:succinate dehydrogenase flavoprotein subunit [Saccharopolyspora rectivirgula]|jgi:succinate dehydrogenase / fumarate reductase flavoprotein subunit|uniref:Succinate dehydrogenase flavoprotein subunit n=1 Tax=Saccharopolyspora rectivirgula TaxID=28042 RepID=A0A073B2G7_9PSEU|nr:succinate dehydrogenase flavoprotein subunit [Saccharopolyspora rectivirgula]KEI46153.1 fumarate reductase [Saccharopolyspora rectivirgula]
MQFHKYDVVIVGAGGAGMRAAIEAGQRARTAVLTKLYPTRSHTGAAQGGMCAALANVEEDNWEWHTFDTIKGGDYLVDQDAAEVMAKEAIDAVLDLERMGLPFNRTPEGKIDQRRFGGHTRDHGKAPVRRACYAADRTGHMILQTLYQNCIKHGVEFFNEFYVLDIAMSEGPDGPVCTGAIAYELATGEIHVFHAKAVVFATGGFGKVFKTTSNAHTLTGDGMGIVYRKGLPLEDMEFYQFHPTGLAGLGILISEAVRGEGGILRNADGERFMERYAPTIKDLAPRDIVARSMALEVREGRGAGPNKDYVLLDVTHLGEDVLESKLPDITEFSRTYLGVEPTKEPVPVYPTAHYAMGGIPTNLDGQVLRDNENTVAGLYAAGECACVSVHGANRLGTNSLLDINVFGRRSGLAAAEYANSHDFVELPPEPAKMVQGMVEHLRTASGGERVATLRTELQQTMDANASVYRTEETLKQALADVQALKERYGRIAVHDKGKRYNSDLLEAIELGFLLDLAEALVNGALARKESRGGHAREDYPNRDDTNFMRHSMQYKVLPEKEDPNAPLGLTGFQSDIRLDYKPVVITRYQPMERKY